MDPIQSLHSLSRSFGPRAAREKLRLLDAISPAASIGAKRLRQLREDLDFMRAYPDDARVLKRVNEVLVSLPPAPPAQYAYSYGNVRRLIRAVPGSLEFDWNEIDDDKIFLEVLDKLVSSGETQSLDEDDLELQDWFAASRPPSARTSLDYFVSLLEGSGHSPRMQTLLYDQSDVPLRYSGPLSCDVSLARPRIAFQRRAIDRSTFALKPIIRRPLRTLRRGGQKHIDLALQALCARKLEIYPLMHANRDDVTIAECGKGLRIVLMGVLPEFRAPLESLYFFLVVKNEAPIAYGPAGVFLGCCEMGINLFPEFRGGEIRYIYAQFMRMLHHVLGVDYFWLTRYGMGEGNSDAIATGAFWFYRKLGFRATNPAVEALAQQEEARIAKRPGYRSDRRMLHRLSRTEAHMDLSNGHHKPFDFGGVGMSLSAFIARHFGGDPRAATEGSAKHIGRMLAMPATDHGLRTLAPTLAMIPQLSRWSARDKAALARIVRSKGGRSEAAAARGFKAHRKLEAELLALASSGRAEIERASKRTPN